MNLLDIAILTLLGIGVAAGLIKGLIKQLFSIAGVIAAYFVSLKLHNLVSFALFGPENIYPRIFVFLAIFVICMILASLAAKLAEKFIESVGMSWANRLAGGMLGFIKGMLVSLVIVVLLMTFLPADNGLFIESITFPCMKKLVALGDNILPEYLKLRKNDGRESQPGSKDSM